MTKSELVENYAIEKLASKVVELEAENKKLYSEIHNLKSQLNRKQTEIERLENEYAEALKKLTDRQNRIEELEKTISYVFPTEPIKVAEMLISADEECSPMKFPFPSGGQTKIKTFGLSELKQIAQHLLVYCNANESEVEI